MSIWDGRLSSKPCGANPVVYLNRKHRRIGIPSSDIRSAWPASNSGVVNSRSGGISVLFTKSQRNEHPVSNEIFFAIDSDSFKRPDSSFEGAQAQPSLPGNSCVLLPTRALSTATVVRCSDRHRVTKLMTRFSLTPFAYFVTLFITLPK